MHRPLGLIGATLKPLVGVMGHMAGMRGMFPGFTRAKMSFRPGRLDDTDLPYDDGLRPGTEFGLDRVLLRRDFLLPQVDHFVASGL